MTAFRSGAPAAATPPRERHLAAIRRPPRPARSPRAAEPVPAGRIFVLLLLAAVTMLFVAFTSSYLIQRAQAGFEPVALPRLLWWNTAVIAASSATLEAARRRLRGDVRRGRQFLGATAALGLLFLAGQVAAWAQLADAGVFMRTSPHSAFFYLLTGVHGLHLLGGLVALAWAVGRVRAEADGRRAEQAVGPAATYWHFMGGLWVYLFTLLAWF